MDWINVRAESVLECVVAFFQITGVAALFVTRLAASTRWAAGGRFALIIAVIGLGLTGALCGFHDSKFALFAGGTITALLIGMTVGDHSFERTDALAWTDGASLLG